MLGRPKISGPYDSVPIGTWDMYDTVLVYLRPNVRCQDCLVSFGCSFSGQATVAKAFWEYFLEDTEWFQLMNSQHVLEFDVQLCEHFSTSVVLDAVDF